LGVSRSQVRDLLYRIRVKATAYDVGSNSECLVKVKVIKFCSL